LSSSARPDASGARFYHLNDCKQEDDALPNIHGLPFEVLNDNRSLDIQGALLDKPAVAHGGCCISLLAINRSAFGRSDS
jgi:hypothetical protein